MMQFNFFIEIAEKPLRADKSAVCAINRHLLVRQGALSRASAGVPLHFLEMCHVLARSDRKLSRTPD